MSGVIDLQSVTVSVLDQQKKTKKNPKHAQVYMYHVN